MPIPATTLTRLQTQHQAIDLLINHISDANLRRQVVVGKWSVFENLVHLATYQHTFFKRIGIILQETKKEFPRYTAEADPLFHDNLERGTSAILEDLRQKREGIVAMLNGLNDDELKRVGLHPAYGEMNIIQWAEFFLLHEAHHLFTIFKLVAELKKL